MELIAPLWRGDVDEVYYYIYFNGHCITIEKTIETQSSIDASRWKSGNYFQTYEEARPYARKMTLAFTIIFNDRANVNT